MITATSPSEKHELPLTAWTDTTRRGSFASFFARYGTLSRADFAAQFRAPVLMTAVSVEEATWRRTLVLKVEKKPSAARIAITPGEAQGDLEAASARIHVGRTPDCDVVIPAPTVSKRHAFFARRDRGWELVDGGSSNGTWLEGQRLKANRRERLRRALSTVQFGPDARFVFIEPAALFELFLEIHRSRGIHGQTTILPASSVVVDPDDFASIPAPATEEAATSAVQSVHPVVEPPRPRSTWQQRRSALGAVESFGRSTDRIEVPVGKTPEEVDAIHFDYALQAVASLGALVCRLDATVGEERLRLLGDGVVASVDECRARLVELRPRIRAIEMELSIGDRKPIEIYRAR